MPNILASNPKICLNWTAICIRLGFLGTLFFSHFHPLFDKVFVTPKTIKPKLSQSQVEELKEISFRVCCASAGALEYALDPSLDNEAAGENKKYFMAMMKEDGSILKEIEVASPFWLKHYGSLGSKSGLMYTLAKLEKRVIEPWGKTAQNENDASSADTRQIMDTVFSNELLPILFQMHHQGYMKMLPGIEADKYSTSTSVFREFNKLMANRGKNVDFSAAFAMSLELTVNMQFCVAIRATNSSWIWSFASFVSKRMKNWPLTARR